MQRLVPHPYPFENLISLFMVSVLVLHFFNTIRCTFQLTNTYVYTERKLSMEVTEMVFRVYINENGRAIEAGNVSAPSYEVAKAFVISEGYDEKDFMLIKAEGGN